MRLGCDMAGCAGIALSGKVWAENLRERLLVRRRREDWDKYLPEENEQKRERPGSPEDGKGRVQNGSVRSMQDRLDSHPFTRT
jgi:hypothetical protein